MANNMWMVPKFIYICFIVFYDTDLVPAFSPEFRLSGRSPADLASVT